MGELGRDGMMLPISLSEEQGPGGGDDDARNSADPGCGGCRGSAAFQSSAGSVRGAFATGWDGVREGSAVGSWKIEEYKAEGPAWKYGNRSDEGSTACNLTYIFTCGTPRRECRSEKEQSICAIEAQVSQAL